MKPRIASAVGVAVKGRPGGKNGGASKKVQDAMNLAVLSARQEGDDDDLSIRQRMTEARQRASLQHAHLRRD